jgi:transposase
VHPSRCKAIASARLKNDKVDAAILARLLRADLLPEAWIAPPPARGLPTLLRHRVHLVRARTLLRNRIHAIVAGHGHDRPRGGYRTGPGRARLASLPLPVVSREPADDNLGLIDAIQDRAVRPDGKIRQRARSGPRVKVLTRLPGAGPFTALVLLAEVGDVSRCGSARKLASRAGLTPAARGSDRVARYGTFPGKARRGCAGCGARRPRPPSAHRSAPPPSTASRNGGGKKIATTAVARRLLTRAWHLRTDSQRPQSPSLPGHPQPRPERRDRTRRGRQAPGRARRSP